MVVSEAAVRLGVFTAVFTAMAFGEAAVPGRARSYTRLRRWPSNLAVVGLITAVVRVLLPGTAVSLALAGERHGWGLLNAQTVPAWAAVIASVFLLDLAIYLQHVMFHAVPFLWRLHRMHHTDLDFDVTTGRALPSDRDRSGDAGQVRRGSGGAGAPALGVFFFEVLLNATSMFNHGNLRIPIRPDRYPRWLVITPDMHRLHHSIVIDETNSNFGFNLPCRDRLLGTYRAHHAAGHDERTIGIEQFRRPRELFIDRIHFQPFRSPTGAYANTWRRAA